MISYCLRPILTNALSTARALVFFVLIFSQFAPAQNQDFRTGTPRIVLTDDMGTITNWPSPPTRQDIEGWVAGYARQGIDIVSWDLVGGTLASYNSKVLEPFPEALGQTSRIVKHLIDSGIDVPAVIAEASHRNGLGYWPAMRINASARYPSKIHDLHPDWFLTGYKLWGGYRPMLNYELPEVRALVMRALRELVEDYDADGLLLNFVRYPSLFDPDRDIQNTNLLTDYIGQVRKMLDEAGRKKGRRLPLAVQVQARPNEGLRYGHDVGAWIRKGYVDYVLPSLSNNVDCNLPVDLWVELVKGTSCRVFPTLHPYFRFPWNVENRATREALRASAHLYYRQGAHGLSTMNMFDALQNQWFRELRDPEQVAAGPHHYRYVPAGTMKTDNMSWRATTPVRIVDEPKSLAGGMLWITLENAKDEAEAPITASPTEGAKQEGELEFSINGQVIPRTERAGKRQYLRHSMNQTNFSRFEFSLSGLPLTQGRNEIGVQIRSRRPYSDAWVTLREVELIVPGLRR